MKNRQSRKN